jgi:hypothetical protein
MPLFGMLIALEKPGTNCGLSTICRYARRSLICGQRQLDQHNPYLPSNITNGTNLGTVKELMPTQHSAGYTFLLQSTLNSPRKRIEAHYCMLTTRRTPTERTCQLHSHKTTKSPHPSIPPLPATSLLISVAIKAASCGSSWKVRRTGIGPVGWDVCSVLGMRDLSTWDS